MDGPVDGGHRDMIQFWTAETSAPSANVTIRDNTMDIGDGRMIQSLFIYNEAVLREGAGQNMFYRNFLIENNHIEGVHPHGILVGETIGLTIRGNTVVKDPTSGVYKHGWEPIIEVASRSQGVTITGNTAHEVPDAMPGWNVGGNRIVPLGFVPGNPLPPPDAAGPKPPVASPTPEPEPVARRGRRRPRHGGRQRRPRHAARPRRQRPAGRQRRRRRADRRRRRRRLRHRRRLAFGRGQPRRAARRRRRQVLRRRRRRGGRPDRPLGHRRQHGGRRQPGLRPGGAGVGRISVVEFGNSATLVRANIDGDAAFEVELMIEDGSTKASAYTAADFIL